MPKNDGDILDNHKKLPKMFNLFLSTIKYDILVNQADNFSINDIQIKNIINEKIDFNHKYIKNLTLTFIFLLRKLKLKSMMDIST